MMWLRRILALSSLIGLSIFGSAQADENDIFGYNSFIDPRELGSRLERDKKTIRGATYSFFGASLGQVWNYRDRSIFTDEDRQFAAVDYHRYWSDWEVSAGYTQFDSEDEATTRRGRISIGHYELTSPFFSEKDEDYLSRWLLAATVDDHLGYGTQYELVGDAYIQLGKKFLIPNTRGNLSVSFRGGSGVKIWRFTYGLEVDLIRFKTNRGRAFMRYQAQADDASYPPLRSRGWESQEHGASGALSFLVEYRLFKQVEARLGYSYALTAEDSGSSLSSGDSNHEFLLQFYAPFGTKLRY